VRSKREREKGERPPHSHEIGVIIHFSTREPIATRPGSTNADIRKNRLEFLWMPVHPQLLLCFLRITPQSVSLTGGH
jgi:hypothetical protein